MNLFLCFTLLCAVGKAPEGAVDPPPFTLTVGQEAVSKTGATDRFLIGEQHRAFAGLASDTQNTLQVVVGYFPLRLTIGPLRVEGGGSVSTSSLPLGGTKWNWVARASLTLAGPLHVEYWHFSNARSAIPNPSLDAVGVAFRWTPGGVGGPKWEPKPVR